MCTSTLPPISHQCKSHGVSNCVADPEQLFRVRCAKCDYVRDFFENGAGAAKYLYHRRRTRAAQGLLSVGAPLDAASASFLCRTSAGCGIISNTSSPHVSFVEGLVPHVDHTAALRQLKDALFRNPTLTVVSVHRVPRRDNVMDLILADVILNPGADCAVQQMADGRVCNLPQFPIHVALGACPRAGGGSKRAAAWAEANLKGVILAMDPTRVRVLPPPEGSTAKQTHRRGSPQRQQHRYKGQMPQQWQHNSAIGPIVTKTGYINTDSFGPFSEPEMDETDAASTSTASSLSEEQEAQFPGLAVDLTFLD